MRKGVGSVSVVAAEQSAKRKSYTLGSHVVSSHHQ